MTPQERRDIAHLHEQIPHGVLFTVVEARSHLHRDPGARMYATASAVVSGSMTQEDLATELLRSLPLREGENARMQTLPATASAAVADAGVLVESGCTPEAVALIQACVASLAGELRIVATVLPEGSAVLQRFVMDERGDVLFASDSLETEDIVPLRRIARTSAHGVVHTSSQGKLFVERMEPVRGEERILENDRFHAEAE